MNYKLTFHAPDENIANAKARGKWPLKIGGIAWDQGDSHIVSDLAPFYEGEKAKKHVHEFLIVEELHEDTEKAE